MIRPLHQSEYIVGSDGTLSLHSLKPGARVYVTVIETEAQDPSPQWGPGLLPGSRVYRPDQPRLPWGSMAEPGFKFENPFDPACDPDEWDALK